jgi:hypothetical protein
MRKTKTVIGAEIQPTKPSARRYYVWQAAMWAIIVHTVLVGGFTAFAVGIVSKYHGSSLDWNWLFNGNGIGPFHRRLAFFMIVWPYPLILSAFALVPIAIITTYRASAGKRAWVWLLAYWLAGTTVCLLLAASIAFSENCRIWGPGNYFYFDNRLTGSVVMCGAFMFPLPVTILAALLTLGGRKRPLDGEAGA